MKIYGIKNCSSMKKAFDMLNQLDLAYEFHDYKKSGIEAETVKQWLNELGVDIVLNKKGTTWRKLSIDEQNTALASQENLIQTLITHTSLIKRPILETPQGLFVGFNEDEYQKLKK